MQLKLLIRKFRPKTEANAIGKRGGGQHFENSKEQVDQAK